LRVASSGSTMTDSGYATARLCHHAGRSSTAWNCRPRVSGPSQISTMTSRPDAATQAYIASDSDNP